ncbi:MAG: phenylacetate-CoA oxygenase subunit PaaJ [Firmicutes bacterium]|nr:phenylacetate-CoA oxygenase subunit PaaJ [Bacillota bacterium]
MAEPARARTPLEEAVWAALEDVKDPEIPVVSVVEMGIVTGVEVDGDRVVVQATPTFVGCPALRIIADGIVRRLLAVPGVAAAEVPWVMEPHWTSERITPAGREKLRAFGLAPPGPAREGSSPPCPYCGSTRTRLENLFGPTACRSLYYCDDCRNPFEGMKRV